MTEHEVRLLLKRYNCDEAAAEEKALLEYWYIHQYLTQKAVDHTLDTEKLEKNINVANLKVEIWQGTLAKSGLSNSKVIRNNLDRTQTKVTNKRSIYSIAAAIMLLLGIGAFFYLNSSITSQSFTIEELVKQNIDLKPGGNRATLTLADGRIIDLNEEKGGIIIDSDALTYTDGTKITKESSLPTHEKMSYNTITTPKGGQYQIVLPDGSRVWLNAASTLKYPSRFDQHERKVELSGEAYFEIARLARNGDNIPKPFIVKSQTQDVEVLGTHFNVNSYANDKSATTTLLEGSVNIHPKDEAKIVKLKPGQQSIVQLGLKTIISTADLDEAVGWKNGEFVFYGETIEKVMNDIARWYDVEVIYKDDVRNKKMWGSVSKFENISTVLKMIELTGTVKFDVSIQGDERRVHIMQ